MSGHGLQGFSPVVRLFHQVVVDGKCWLYGGHLNEAGYAQMDVDGRRQPRHVAAYELLVGPVPEGLELDHLCRIPACFNPAHLEAVPPVVNNLRSDSWGGVNARKDGCPQGHLFDEANTYHRNGRRHCRACRRAASLRHYHRTKELIGS